MKTSEHADVREIGRRLGYDLYRYRRNFDRTALPTAIDEGWLLAAARQVPAEGGDRFVNKWLQLRINALKRGRVVDDRITTQYLKRIDVSSCPVMRVVLTHGERLDTDWSVDRLNNEGGYAPHNLAVMSTAANRAKGGRSFDEVLGLSRCADCTEGLAPHEWLRMASLMLGACFAPHAGLAPLIPLAAPVAPCTVQPAAQVIQHVFTLTAGMQAGKNGLVKHFRVACPTESARIRLARFAETMHRGLKHATPCWDVWLEPELMAAFLAWRSAMDTRSWAVAGAIAGRIVRSDCIAPRQLQSWQLADRGYMH